MKKKLLLLLLSCTLFTGCGAVPLESEPQPFPEEAGSQIRSEDDQSTTPVSSESPETDTPEISSITLTNSYERAAFFADQTYVIHPGNTLVSPLSLDMALGLAAEGASGTTAEELYAYLGGKEFTEKAADYIAYAEGLTKKTKTKGPLTEVFVGGDEDSYTFQFTIANSIWVNEKRKLQEEYADRVRAAYLAEVDSVDFETDKEGTAKRINSWCDERTNGLIPEIIQPNQLTADLATILINSVYFESPWADKWGKREGDFTDLSGNTTTQEMLMDGLNDYFENDKATAFAKPYYNGFEFIGILPREEGDFQISDLDLESLLASRTGEYDVYARMPKLNFECTSDKIIPILQAQGVQLAFDETAAEFDRIIEQNPDEVTYISDIIQKCRLELDEEGTSAAAVTAVLMKCGTAAIDERPRKDVYLDRPFAFLIYDSQNDTILFVGKVVSLD
ncbi:MAG: serpin family protein [Acetatifactor sp.]